MPTPPPSSLEKLCTCEGCEKPVFASGLCVMHYSRMARHGSTDVLLHKPRQQCRTTGCRHLAATPKDGLCNACHFKQLLALSRWALLAKEFLDSEGPWEPCKEFEPKCFNCKGCKLLSTFPFQP
jgi:hypothetical protein